MAEYALQHEFYDSIPRPEIITGHILLGRSVLRSVDPEEFAGNAVLMNLSNQDIYSNVRNTKKIVRKQTLPENIVNSVLKITHRSLNPADKANLDKLVESLLQEYGQSIDLSDKHISEAIDEKMPKLSDTDLMKGMQAFSEAEYDQHQGSYEYTLLAPARRLASWMLLREAEIDHA